MEGIKYQPPMTLPLYQYYMIPKLKHTWITSILLDTQFMFLKIIFGLVNLTKIVYTDPESYSTCHIHLTMLSTYPFYSTRKLSMFTLDLTTSIIINSTPVKGMKSLNKFGNINPNFKKKLLNHINSTIYQKNTLFPI